MFKYIILAAERSEVLSILQMTECLPEAMIIFCYSIFYGIIRSRKSIIIQRLTSVLCLLIYLKMIIRMNTSE
jgi:hypothetical protein